jgi:hypothetical protein
MKGVLKIPIPTAPPSLPPISIPAFDYIIDIYADKVVVNDAYGNTVATLSTVNDLNNWFKNVRNKKIRINANVVVTQDLVLTSNEYWIFGEWINANVYILESNTTIYSWAPMGNDVNDAYVSNWSPDTGDYTEAHGLRFYAFTFADVDIEGIEGGFTLQNIIIYVAYSSTSFIEYVSGDIYINGEYIYISDSVLRNAYIVAWMVLYFYNVKGNQGIWIIISCSHTDAEQVSLDNVLSAYMSLTRYEDIAINPNSSATINLLNFGGGGAYCVKVIGLLQQSTTTTNTALNPLPSGITWSINPDTAQLTITNSTSQLQNIEVVYYVEIGGI